MQLAIAKKHTFFSLLRYSLPSIIMMVFMSLYTIVDGFFVSRFVGTIALSAVNIVYPCISILTGIAIMLATGGSAIVARQLGEGNEQPARENFTLIILTGILIGMVLSIIGGVFTTPLARFLGADEELLPYCQQYLQILLFFAPFNMLQMLFQTFTMTAGKPFLGMGLTIGAGLLNAVLDYLFIAVFQWGIAGAALATAAGYLLPSTVGLLYFWRTKNTLRFTRPRLDWRVLLHSCTNGSSEMVTELSTSIVTFLFNLFMLKYLGNDGVAAITIVLYVQFLMTALHLGFSLGTAPIFSYHYGGGDVPQLKNTWKICALFTVVASALVFVVALFLAPYMISGFSPRGSAVYDIAVNGMKLFSISFLFAGFNIFSSSLFTALSNGKISAIISFSRTFGFIVLGFLLLPPLLQVNGIWLAVPFAELCTIFVSLAFQIKKRNQYQYL